MEKLINELYNIDFFIERSKLERILNQGEDIIPYLEDMIDDGINNYEKYKKEEAQLKENFEWFFVLHALFLLAELEAEKSLPKILELLSQDYEVLDFWMGDLLTEDVRHVICKLGKNQLGKLEDFLKDKSNTEFVRAEVSSGLVQIVLNNPEKRNEILEIYRDILVTEDNIDLLGLIICDILNFNGWELKEEIYQAFEQGKVNEMIVNRKNIYFDKKRCKTKKNWNIFKQYDEYRNSFLGENSPHNPRDDKEVKQVGKFFENKPQPRRVEKIGRNEPCPCGSGVKYKKCCGK